MATLYANLIARRDAIGVELAALDATKPGGLPNAQGNPDEVGYKDGLYRELANIKELLADLDATGQGDSGYGEVTSEMAG